MLALTLAAAQPITPGDTVEITAPGTELRATELVVDVRGFVDLAEFGLLALSGLDEAAAGAALRVHLGRLLRNTEGTSLTLKRRGRLVKVSGMVRAPRLVGLATEGDLWTALSAADGLRPGADLSRVLVIRGENRTVVDVRAYLTGDAPLELPRVLSGDTIFVPALRSFAGEGRDADRPTRSALVDEVLVTGAVRKPGRYPRPAPFDPWVALALAGGPEADADLSAVRLLTARGGERIDLAARSRGAPPLDGTGGEDLISLHVPSRKRGANPRLLRTVHVLGAVGEPGPVPVDGPVRLLDALSMASGPTDSADLRSVEVIHRRAGATLSTRYDLRARIAGAEEDVILQPGDTVLVGDDGEDSTRVALQALSNVAIIAGVVLVLMTQVSQLQALGER
jgi:protein involved in polysaccharide export with SLBB domain